jgi:hypothetical protein
VWIPQFRQLSKNQASTEFSHHRIFTPIGGRDGSSVESAPHAPVAQMDRVAASEGTIGGSSKRTAITASIRINESCVSISY